MGHTEGAANEGSALRFFNLTLPLREGLVIFYGVTIGKFGVSGSIRSTNAP
jgi:hypothetical protein